MASKLFNYRGITEILDGRNKLFKVHKSTCKLCDYIIFIDCELPIGLDGALEHFREQHPEQYKELQIEYSKKYSIGGYSSFRVG